MKLKVTDLLKKKEQMTNESKEVMVESLGGSLEVKKLPLGEFLQMLDSFSEKTTTSEAVRMQSEIIYESCPILHDNELQTAFGCVEPTDIVLKVLGDNLSEVTRIFNEIMGFYGMMDEDLKN